MKSPAILVALGAALVVSGCNQSQQAARHAEPRPVLVAEAHYAPREQAQVLAGVIKARIESEGWTLVGTYTDHARSGASHLRPGYQRLLADARARCASVEQSRAALSRSGRAG